MLSRRAMLIGGGVVGAGIVGAGGLAGRRAWLDREPEALALQDTGGRLLWSNWSGIEHAYPAARVAPKSEDELVHLLKTAAAPIRPVGAGPSFTGLVPTSGTLLTLDAMRGVVSHDAAATRAVVRGGTRLADLGPALSAIGQEMSNLPDINKQSIAGAIATGTHGTGRGIRALHGDVVGLRIATPSGELIDCDATSNPEIFHAARVGLGAFGVVTQLTLQNRPLKRILKRTYLQATEEVLAAWPALQRQHRNVEFLVLPFTGASVIITHDETDRPVKPRGPDRDTETLMGLKRLRDIFEFAPGVRLAAAKRALRDIPPEEMVDDGWKLLSNERPVRFKEIEYHLPLDAQVPALRDILKVIETRRGDVFFPIEARVIAPDDAWLSPFYGREAGSIAVHAYYKDDHDFFFSLIEPIFRRYDGRPHWGKLHSLTARDFASLYPRWREAGEVRRALDPKGRLLNDHLRRVLVDAG